MASSAVRIIRCMTEPHKLTFKLAVHSIRFLVHNWLFIIQPTMPKKQIQKNMKSYTVQIFCLLP